MSRLSQSLLLRAWAQAIFVSRVHLSELSALRGSVVMPKCTRHERGCGCARGVVRRFQTNHAATSLSRSFEEIRRVLGAVPWHEDGDLEVVA